MISRWPFLPLLHRVRLVARNLHVGADVCSPFEGVGDMGYRILADGQQRLEI